MRSISLERVAFSFFMSLIMSGSMSLVMFTLDSSLALATFQEWPKQWLIAFVIAFPTGLIANGLINKLFQFFKSRHKAIEHNSSICS